MSDLEQESADRFYASNGQCCAGCDWWARFSGAAGECRKAAPVSGRERSGLLGLDALSCRIDAGHPLTHRAHFCGDFRDSFDWSSLPITYLARIGGRHLARTALKETTDVD